MSVTILEIINLRLEVLKAEKALKQKMLTNTASNSSEDDELNSLPKVVPFENIKKRKDGTSPHTVRKKIKNKKKNELKLIK